MLGLNCFRVSIFCRSALLFTLNNILMVLKGDIIELGTNMTHCYRHFRSSEKNNGRWSWRNCDHIRGGTLIVEVFIFMNWNGFMYQSHSVLQLKCCCILLCCASPLASQRTQLKPAWMLQQHVHDFSSRLYRVIKHSEGCFLSQAQTKCVMRNTWSQFSTCSAA